MLPFLKPRKQTGLIVRERTPDGSSEEQHSEGNEYDGLEACADDILRAINSKDSKQLASALRAAFEILDAEPHVEGEHIEDDGNEQG